MRQRRENDNPDGPRAWRHHPGGGPSWGEGPWGGFGPGHGGRGGRGRGPAGMPPWVAGFLGLQDEARRGPRVRRGDVRSAVISILATAHEEGSVVNGYQVIQLIGERSGGHWRPSPGSVYPTIQQLQDEGLVDSDEERGRRAIRLSEEGRAYAAERADELAAVWRPFEADPAEGEDRFGGLRGEIGQVMGAVWQVATTGTADQRDAAAEVLADTRRRIYGILADGPAGPEADEDETDGPAQQG